ncbi:hypothetical protein MKW94_025411 [Papaver nudicaule]|uniref:Pentatricopeptide repeat-containing protein n=1 Tax=Papaver nudicaule TaxID=74823 RepID=A0AA41VBQ5_PAPNU|nr:hypothetical protein [Papaver nudicaule]
MFSSQHLVSCSSKTFRTFSQLTRFLPRGIHGGDDSNKNPDLISSNSNTSNNASSKTSSITQVSDKLCKIMSKNQYNSQLSISSNRYNTHLLLNGSGIKVVTPELGEQVLKKLTNAGALALSFFRWAEKQQGFEHTTGIYNALIDSLGKIKQFQLICDIVYCMDRKGILTNETFGLIMRRYARARRAGDTVDELGDLNCLLGTLCKSKNARKAQEVFNEMVKRRKSFVPDVKTYAVLLEGWGEARNLVMLKKVYREMRDEGLELLREIGRMGKCTCGCVSSWNTHSRTYDIIIHHLIRVNRTEEAYFLFQRMAGDFGCEQNLNTYAMIVRMFLWYQMKDRGVVPGMHMFASLILSTQEMLDLGIRPPGRLYDNLKEVLLDNGKVDEAISIGEKLDNIRKSPWTG